MIRQVVLLLLLAGCGPNKTPQPTHQPYEAGALPQLQCLPNLDGQIDATELQPVLGNPVNYLVSPFGMTRTVDLTGSVNDAGQRAWDFGADYASDEVATITATGIGGKWYAGSFPGATFVAPFDAGDTVEAVYAYNSTAITLLGLASHDPTPMTKTLLVYAPPIELYRFPLSVGVSYTSSGTITNGTLNGVPYAGTDTYDVSVDASGQLTLESYVFTQVLRVRTTVTVAPSAGGQSIVTRQTSFLFECFGEVARATSQPGETNDDFTTAAELRRLN